MPKKEIIHIGLDVDDKSFHAYAFSVSTGEVLEFSCLPNVLSLKKKLVKHNLNKENLKICYEAGYLGFSLYRELSKMGYHCDIIAPSLIPNIPGKKVKTDRLDAQKLAKYYAADLLTLVHVPSEEQEADRQFLRSRKFLVEQISDIKKHINSELRVIGWVYSKTIEKKCKNWTVGYVKWLRDQIANCSLESIKFNLEILLRHYESLNERLFEYDNRIEKMVELPKYKEKVDALICYRGIKKQTAMVLITELGDVRRFSHPSKLTSYAGLDVIERSSGGNERKFGISKNGNRHIRTAIVEACQTASNSVVVSRILTKRRLGIEGKYIEIADRCMQRLNKKSRRMLALGKNKNKVKVACAREMLGFVWESLRASDIKAV